MKKKQLYLEEALDGVGPGGFSERIRVLDNRRVYRPLFINKEE